MKLRTQFIITLVIFGLVLILMAASLLVTNRQVEWLTQQEEIAHNIEREISELGYLSNEYLLYRESQQRDRWEAKFAAFSADLSRLEPDSPEQRAIIDMIKTNQQHLKAVFTEVASNLETQGSVELTLIQVPWSRMAVQNQGMSFDAARLSQKLRDQADRLKQTNTVLIFALIGILGAYFATNYWLIYRRTLSALAELEAGTKMIGSGNLDFALPSQRADEIGALGQAFNRMTANLKEITASKADLEREVTRRQKAEEEIRQLNESLENRVRERTAQLEASNKELEAFAYSISHDLRTPLRGIDGFSQALLEDYAGQLDETGQRYLQRVRAASQRMGHLIDDLLALSRLTRSEMHFERVNLSELAQSIAEDLHQAEPERLVGFVIAGGMEVQADASLMRIALENLLGNAWKFTAKHPSARIEFGTIAHNGRPAYFVRDDGAGFEMAYADKLFSAFQRLHTPAEFAGTGIGLAMVQRIIRRHGGQVWAEGAVEQGATIYFTL